ncbi:MAG: phosphate signaling complex PhoU family protein [Nitriliruptoraceae bacterium]
MDPLEDQNPVAGPAPADLPPLRTALDGEPGMRSEFRERLDAVDDELTGAALRVADALPGVVRAFLAADREAASRMRALAADVHDRCRLVEEMGFVLLALDAPVAGDLRRLVALLRLVHDVERSASLAAHVVASTTHLDPRLLPPDLRTQVEELARRSADVFCAGLDAWRRRDALAGHELGRDDHDGDRLRTRLLLEARRLEGDPEAVLALGLLGRYLERLADHGVRFAQHATFAVTGERVEVGA